MSRPVIGLTLDSEQPGGYSAMPWYALRENYSRAVARAGGLPILLPHEAEQAADYLDRLDGVIVTGGAFDVDPALFGDKTRHPTVKTKDRRTAFELALTRGALDRDMPLLGICGGEQLLNIVLGGTLIQHVPDEVPGALPHEPRGGRIAKRLARAGLCSRRDAERWIAEGRVVVNGKKLSSPACNVGEGDRILVDGKPVPAAEPARLWRYHKPRGLVTTARDPQGRPTVFDALPAGLPRVIAVGRLDLGSEGLLLLTNDGELARRLELPATGWVRRYRVRVHGAVEAKRLEALAKGITI